MKKTLVFSFAAIIALSANVVSAQGYVYGTPTYGNVYQAPYAAPYSGACTSIVSDLSYGMRGGQVSQLQTFLVSQNFPGGGSWMITGYFGTATLAAVRNFQQQQGLPLSGIVDTATRSAISRVSCGAYTGGYNTYPYTVPPIYNYNNNYNNNTNCYYTYPYTCNTYLSNNVVLTSLSVSSGQPGTSVTIFGSGFDYSNNTVYVGMAPLTNIPSYNGTSITFTVPSYSTAGTVALYVTNSHGTSNTLSFSITNTYGCSGQTGGGYVYGTYSGAYGYNYCPPNSNTPYVTYMSSNSAAVGATVTIYGTGFSSQDNMVRFGSGTIPNIPSYNGTSLTFVVPSYLSGYGSQTVTPGTYNVSVSNSAGYTSNAVSFTVTSYGSYGAPTINSVNGPTSLTTGTQGTWTISVNNPSASYMTTSVNWGDAGYIGLAAPQTTYQSGSNALTFTHTYSTPGTYTVTFTVSNSSGQTNTSTATVNVTSGGSYGNVTLSSISPMSAHIGTQIVLNGSGFTPLENTVHFGIGGTQHVPSQNGTTIYYTVPSFVSPCDLVTQGGLCAQNIQQVLSGPIQVYVTNGNGTTNTILFQVQ